MFSAFGFERAGMLVFAGLMMHGVSTAQQRPVNKAPAGKSSGKAGAVPSERPKFKAIWEPVNYAADAQLLDVHFVSADVGWAAGQARTDAGAGGIIIHTRDGGQTWTVQLGDPRSATLGFKDLQFIDETHGWAAQFGSKLVRTTDGQTWEEMGTFPTGDPYTFVSHTTGFRLEGQRMMRTDDAGRSWEPLYACRVRLEVDGLAREVACDFVDIHFPSPRVGYAVTKDLPNSDSAVFKTTDGGITWGFASFVPHGAGLAVAFSDPNTGFVRVYGGSLFGTFDGAQTWKGIPIAKTGGKIHFANPQVGWKIEGNPNQAYISYTSDGGQRWSSVETRFPAAINASSLPRPDRGYVVGDHGMVYRYRIVPFEYTAPRLISAPSIAASPAQ